jgi:hypothetical protein
MRETEALHARTEDHGVQTVTFVDEVIEEAVGTSSKKWALILVAFVAGAIAAVWLTRRARSSGSAITRSDVETA